jgi:ABC-type nitrate/sulfonate/bicarbonate transport system substrate-binding protein
MKPRKTNGLAVLSCLLLATPVSAETLRVGYAAQSPTFSAPIDTAQEQGFFKQVGLDVVPTTFGGGAKLHAAMIAGASDIGLGTGSDFAFIVKGAPEKCVYLVVDKPFSIGVAITNPAINRRLHLLVRLRTAALPALAARRRHHPGLRWRRRRRPTRCPHHRPDRRRGVRHLHRPATAA